VETEIREKSEAATVIKCEVLRSIYFFCHRRFKMDTYTDEN